MKTSTGRLSQVPGLRGAAALALLAFAGTLWQPWTVLAQAPAPSRVRYAQVSPADLKEWLTYLSSDTLQGRQVVHAKATASPRRTSPSGCSAWGVKPLGDERHVLRERQARGYRSTRNSSVTVDGNGQTRTFKHGDHVTFAAELRRQADARLSTASSSSATARPRTVRAATSRASWWSGCRTSRRPRAGVGGRGRGGAGRRRSTRYGAAAAIGFAPLRAPTAAEQALDAGAGRACRRRPRR